MVPSSTLNTHKWNPFSGRLVTALDCVNYKAAACAIANLTKLFDDNYNNMTKRRRQRKFDTDKNKV